jgi:hypothetical protein
MRKLAQANKSLLEQHLICPYRHLSFALSPNIVKEVELLCHETPLSQPKKAAVLTHRQLAGQS